ncbi:MAG: hypothetical protein ACREL5_02310, partial [Gemmatimonadales bacterium]
MMRFVGAAFLAMAGLPGSLSAQSSAERDSIEAFRDSIGAVNDSVSLLRFERELIGHASKELRDSAMVHLRLGFLAMRLGDLSGKRHFEDAASEFQWALDLQPRWPYGWFGLGLAELGVGDAEFALLRGLQTALGKDALTRSANDFARSAEVDPGFVRGLVELSNTALRQRVNIRLDVALQALRRAAAMPAGRNPAVLLARARVEREAGSADSARAAIDSLLADDPSNAEALLEQARVRFKLGRLDGADPWYRGLALADPAAVALYRTDLRFVLPDSTLRAFDAARGEQRAGLMRRFWSARDNDELRPPGSRLMEHYRRLDVARHDYRLASTHRHYDIVERYRPAVAEFDDRGVIYIRQGTPDDQASYSSPVLPPNESWVYHRPGGHDLLFHFVAREGVTDYRLVESALDVLGYATAVRLENSGDIQGTDGPLLVNPSAAIGMDSIRALRQRVSDDALSRMAEAILRSRQQLNPIYNRMLASGKAGASGLERDERTLGSRSIRSGTTTDAWPRTWPKPLDAWVVVAATGGDSQTVRVAYAVRQMDSGATHVLATVTRADGTAAASLDTLDDGHRSAVVHRRTWRLGLLSLDVPPGRYTARVALETGDGEKDGHGKGAITQPDSVDIAPTDGTIPALSDLALGTSRIPLFWVAANGTDTVWVNPFASFRAGDPARLYFEVSGVPVDSSYRVELTIKRVGRQSFFRKLLGIFGGGTS